MESLVLSCGALSSPTSEFWRYEFHRKNPSNLTDLFSGKVSKDFTDEIGVTKYRVFLCLLMPLPGQVIRRGVLSSGLF